MMNPRLESSLKRASVAMQVLVVLLFIWLSSVALQALRIGLPPGVNLNYIWLGFMLLPPLWFIAQCGKVLADLHSYCYWAQENAMAGEGRKQGSVRLPE